MTDRDGRYGWDVPAGEWKVVWEKAGYETESSEELTVPPPHFNVNAGLVSKVAPKVKTVTAVTYENGSFVDVIFDKYLMTAGTLQENTITVKDGNGAFVSRRRNRVRTASSWPGSCGSYRPQGP
jgi:hypothetical protein